MAEIKFPKIEIEPAGLERLEDIVKRFEDAAKKITPIPEAYLEALDVIAKQQHDINILRQEYRKLLEFCHRYNTEYNELYNELLGMDERTDANG